MSIAIIGLGKMGRIYDRLLRASYIVDIQHHPGRVVFPHVDEFVAYGPKVDLVIVATPSNTHFSIASRLLEAGYNLLVEKPICLSAREAEILQRIADEKKLILSQSTLERHNPLIKFLKENVSPGQVERIESFRFGTRPERLYVEDAKFDLAIHDVDLYFHLFEKRAPWRIDIGYGKPRRELLVYLKDGRVIRLDLLHKQLQINGYLMDFGKSSPTHPILEMIYQVLFKGTQANERWSEEIRILEQSPEPPFLLTPENVAPICNGRAKGELVLH